MSEGDEWSVHGELSRLRTDVDGLREYRAEQRVRDVNMAANVEALTDTMRDFHIAVQSLEKTIATSRGALWVLLGLTGTFGAAAGALVSLLAHKPA